ncbi:MAG: tRNA pseudouridine(13) synthase TruD [Candidatus Diapherotrites archaeon]|uniref:Probable tRNA pseudouridine synthase D n=1 Tax=Candidatus Iainarchaeum sp. TaxID=3101447 RepID=A0A8T4C8I9_9ARCH|nr:tRNA pseudouridine(13) synthase TruD [Candidatus Diapherotrites archaeon]
MNLPYFTKTTPLGGELKRRIEDFVVEEILEDGTVCEIEQLNQTPLNKIALAIPTNPNPIKFDQLHVRMEKFNIETTFAIRTLSRGTGGSVKRIGYAGLKDKRALTCQRISLWRPDVAKLSKFFVKGLALHHAQWSDKRVDLGMLRGNKFTIIIRNINGNEDEIREKIQSFTHNLINGVPNYFGEQRFGGYREITHVVGKLLLENKIEEAVMEYLCKESKGEQDDLREARKHLRETRDYANALKTFPDSAHFEIAMLNHLVKNPHDFAGAFQRLPQQTRYLFTHAYQSHVFNLIVSERVKRKLMYPMEGDVLENGIPTAILPGIRTTMAKGIPGEIEQDVLNKEKISPQFFANPNMGELASWGARKTILLNVHGFQLINMFADEFNEGKNAAKVTFWLDKGNYATVALRELLKNE